MDRERRADQEARRRGIAAQPERSFTDAPVFAFPGATLIAAVFLVVGAFAARLAASDVYPAA